MSEVRKKLIRNLLIIVGIFVLVAIILMLYQGCSNNKKLSYSEIENKLKTASEKYFKKLNLLPVNDGDTAIVGSEVLISNKYLKKMEEMTDDKNCFGKIIVEKNGDYYNYMPYLKCDNYETKTFLTDISSKVVTEGDGIYVINNEYIYRGETVNNYVKIGENVWRIIKVTGDGYLKLIKEKRDETEYVWDDRYNISTNDYTGIDDFEKSRLKETLTNIYDNNKETITNSFKKYIVPKELCIGDRNENDLSFNIGSECDKKSEKMFISLIHPSDYANISLDPNCKDFSTKSCNNYNYSKDVFKASWSTIGVKGKASKKIYYIDYSDFSVLTSNKLKRIQLLVYVNANNIVVSGDGTEKNPYKLY